MRELQLQHLAASKYALATENVHLSTRTLRLQHGNHLQRQNQVFSNKTCTSGFYSSGLVQNLQNASANSDL